jgi:hypothetical protein
MYMAVRFSNPNKTEALSQRYKVSLVIATDVPSETVPLPPCRLSSLPDRHAPACLSVF